MESEKEIQGHWEWRLHMAKCIAESIQPDRFGVRGLYLIGSVKNGTAGPASDIDLLIHFRGSPTQMRELQCWLDGWGQCLAETNRLRTGEICDTLLDVHFVTDENIKNQSSFASHIGAVTDGARPLFLKT